MKFLKGFLISGICLMLAVGPALSNPDRTGQAGADQLLQNPWSASTGMATSNMAKVSGYESMNLNPAGLVGDAGTEVGFAHTRLLGGSDMAINTGGFNHTLGFDDAHAVGLSIESSDLGEFTRRTRTNPEGDLGTYEPQFLNVAAGYSRLFSQAIRGGAAIRVISEQTPEIDAVGVSLDAGIQYVAGVAGEDENLRFGISLRNIGPAMQYTGTGLDVRGTTRQHDFDMTLRQRSQSFELPSLLSIGGHYAFYLNKEEQENEEGELEEQVTQQLNLNAAFVSHSFREDQYHFGVEYDYEDLIFLRGGFTLESGMGEETGGNSVYSGPSAGTSVNIPLGDELGAKFLIDYSIRTTNNFNLTHNFGGRFTF